MFAGIILGLSFFAVVCQPLGYHEQYTKIFP
jgi:hypothetical protein